MAEAKDKFRLISNHPEDLGNGRVANVDEEVGLTAKEQEEPTIVRLLEEGKLVSTFRPEPEEDKTKEPPKQPAQSGGKGTAK